MSNQFVSCPRCGKKFEVFASRKTNHGHQHCRDLIYWLNTETVYEADAEPRINRHRDSGKGIRPDIKVRAKTAKPREPFILVERQEQNTPGTGYEKIANKIHKAHQALRELDVSRYYIVIAGKRLDLLRKAADDAYENGQTHRHERLRILDEDSFRQLAAEGRL